MSNNKNSTGKPEQNNKALKQLGNKLLTAAKNTRDDKMFNQIIAKIKHYKYEQSDIGTILKILDHGRNALFLCILSSQYDFRVEKLLYLITEQKILAKVIAPQGGNNAFLEAVKGNQEGIVELILKKFTGDLSSLVDIIAPENGKNAFLKAVEDGKKDIVELILKKFTGDLSSLADIIAPRGGNNAFLKAVEKKEKDIVELILGKFNISKNYVQDDIEAQRALPDIAALLTKILTLNDGNILCNVAREKGMDTILDKILKTLSNVFGSSTSDKFRRVLQSKNIDSGVPLENKWINKIQKDDNEMKEVAVKHFLNAKMLFSLPYQLQGQPEVKNYIIRHGYIALPKTFRAFLSYNWYREKGLLEYAITISSDLFFTAIESATLFITTKQNSAFHITTTALAIFGTNFSAIHLLIPPNLPLQQISI